MKDPRGTNNRFKGTKGCLPLSHKKGPGKSKEETNPPTSVTQNKAGNTLIYERKNVIVSPRRVGVCFIKKGIRISVFTVYI